MSYQYQCNGAPGDLFLQAREHMMTGTIEVMITAVLVGIAGTAILDLFSLLMERLFGVPATNWRMVGRWLGHMLAGRFVQPNLKQAEPISSEHAIGWIFHYVVGAGYGPLLVALWGADWLRAPEFTAPMILVLVLLVLPFFVMMPAMGLGIAGARTPNPTVTRLKSVLGHSVFGIGMYLAALMLG